MSSRHFYGNERSVDSQTNTDEEESVSENRCPECEGRVISDGFESFCETCGLVVSTEILDVSPTSGAHGPRRSGPEEWAIEPTTVFRVNHGLGGRFNLGRDGQGRVLSFAAKQRFGRLRKFDKRMTKREVRTNEALRDVQAIGGNLDLPRYVCEEAARLLWKAADARLPGGRMSWEGLAGGAVVLATRGAETPRDIGEVARYAKTTEERVCAGARKIRIELGLVEELPPVRTGTVDLVVAEFDDLDETVEADVRRIGMWLMRLADEAGIGPGTPRTSVGAGAVYAATRLLGTRVFTQQEVADAASAIVETSTCRVATYSREVYDAHVKRYGTDPSVVLRTGSQTMVE